ncbi:MAG: hypothetical protein IKJ43_01830 [Bacilli bacterium]|nr:hypothetical protein [Bacilli bacterium]
MKRKILKVLGISFLVFAVLSWIIPVGTYSGGKLETSSISPIGLVDLINTPISAMITFALYGVVFAIIGGFYGVLEETGVLGKIANGWAIRFEGREKRFLVISIIVFSIIASLTGLTIPLFALVPLFAAAIFKMGFDKITALASTVGGILVGNIGSTYGFNFTGYTKNLLSLDMNNQIWARMIILVLLVVLLCVTVVLSSKKKENEEVSETKASSIEDDVKEIKAKGKTKKNTKSSEKKEEVKTTSKKTSSKKSGKTTKTTKTASKSSGSKNSKTTKTTKKTTKKSNTKAAAVVEDVKVITEGKRVSAVPFAIIFVLMFIVAFVGMYNWFYSFDVSLFNDIHEAIMGVKIGGFKIFENLFHGISQLGYWSNVEFAGLLLFTSLVIKFVYRMKFNDYVEAFIGGVKKWIPTAFYVALANVVLVVLYQAMQGGTGTLVDTINGTIMKTVDGFNPFVTGICAFVGSFFFNDLYYLLADMSSFITSFDSDSLKVAGVLVQSVYAVAMMVFPTSVALIAGLSMFDVSYGKWMKYIWKFVLIAFLLVMLVCGILTLL